jgi:hypothetical protein
MDVRRAVSMVASGGDNDMLGEVAGVDSTVRRRRKTRAIRRGGRCCQKVWILGGRRCRSQLNTILGLF